MVILGELCSVLKIVGSTSNLKTIFTFLLSKHWQTGKYYSHSLKFSVWVFCTDGFFGGGVLLKSAQLLHTMVELELKLGTEGWNVLYCQNSLLAFVVVDVHASARSDSTTGFQTSDLKIRDGTKLLAVNGELGTALCNLSNTFRSRFSISKQKQNRA